MKLDDTHLNLPFMLAKKEGRNRELRKHALRALNSRHVEYSPPPHFCYQAARTNLLGVQDLPARMFSSGAAPQEGLELRLSAA